MTKYPAQLSRVLQALADPTRRAVLERLGAGPGTVTELARPFGMALPSFTRHLAILDRCGLIRSRKSGRVRTFELVPTPLRVVEEWLAGQRDTWRQRLDQLDRCVVGMEESPP